MFCCKTQCQKNSSDGRSCEALCLLNECSNRILLIAWQLNKVPMVHYYRGICDKSPLCSVKVKITQAKNSFNSGHEYNVMEFGLVLIRL